MSQNFEATYNLGNLTIAPATLTVTALDAFAFYGEPGKVNISAATYELVKGKFNCSYRGQIFAKNVGDIDMYFVEQEVMEPVNKEMLVS